MVIFPRDLGWLSFAEPAASNVGSSNPNQKALCVLCVVRWELFVFPPKKVFFSFLYIYSNVTRIIVLVPSILILARDLNWTFQRFNCVFEKSSLYSYLVGSYENTIPVFQEVLV